MAVSSTSIHILGADEVLSQFRALRSKQPVQYRAFYSSQLGGVVTDPALMVIPFDDHIVHRGHGIFDTAALVDGKIYDLEAHLDRFLLSAERSKLRLARLARRHSRHHRANNRGERPARRLDTLLAVVRARQPRADSGGGRRARFLRDGVRRPVVSRAVVHRRSAGDDDHLSDQAPLYAMTKATNYLPNVLMQMEAKESGFDNGVFIDENGHVGESSNMNVAFVTADGVFTHPKFDHILSGCTSLRLLELAPGLKKQGLLTGVEVRDIPVADARASREMVLLGSSVKVAPIVQWDDQPIGDGKPGPVAKALLGLLDEDMRSSDRLIDVPY